MICYLHYISARNRLTEAEKTVTMLKTGNSEDDVPSMVLAQREFIRKELEFFEEQCIKWNYILFGCFLFGIIAYVYMKGVYE